MVASYKPGETPGPAKSEEEADLIDLKRVQDSLAAMLARGYVLGRTGVDKAKALDSQLGVSQTLVATAEDLNSRLRITERGKEAAKVASEGAQALKAKALELNEKHQILNRGRSLVADGVSTVSATLDKAGPPGEAVKSAAMFTRGLFARATAGAADLVSAARSKVEELSKEGALKGEESDASPSDADTQAVMEPLPQSTPAAAT